MLPAHIGLGIVKGFTGYSQERHAASGNRSVPEQKLNVSRRLRGNELIWDNKSVPACYLCQDLPPGSNSNCNFPD